MKAEKFDGIVKARTDEITDEKIDEFKKDVHTACRKLFGDGSGWGYEWDRKQWDDEYRKSLGILASENNEVDWPVGIMERIKSTVVEELMKTFDEFTKASLAASRAAEPKNKMEEPKETPSDGKV